MGQGTSQADRQELYLTVIGDPAPQGSKRYLGNGRFIEASPKIPAWRNAVSMAVANAHEATGDSSPFTGPITVVSTFYMRRPKSVKRNYPSVVPDLDKLERGLWDALTQAGAWQDDSLVIMSLSSKVYADDRPPGATVEILSADSKNNILINLWDKLQTDTLGG